MLEALGVPTSVQTFSLFETGEQLWRGDEPSPTRSSVLVRARPTRTCASAASSASLALGDQAAHPQILDYAIRHYAPDLVVGERTPASAFLRVVT